MAKALVGCCGWSYGDLAEKGGWTGAFYPGTSTKKLPYYSKFFDTAEMDSTFYEKFYKYMTPSTFRGMASATPDEFEFSVKVPETVTHDKKLDVSKGAINLFEEFVDKISPLKITNKLGAILIQLPPVKEFKNTESLFYYFALSGFGHHLNSSYRMITSFEVIDALTALILGFVMNMFISSSMDSVLANIFTLWFSVIVDVFKSQL